MQISEGMTVHQGTKVGVVQNLDPIKLEGQMTAAQTALLKGADELPFYVPGTSIKASGKIVYVSNVANAQTDKYELDLEAVNPGMNLKPGMKAQIQLGNKQDLMALSVPTYSIVKEDGNAYVFVLNHDTVEKRKVQLGRLNEPIQEIVSGLKEGEFVVVSGQNRLKDKEKVGMVNVQTQNKAG